MHTTENVAESARDNSQTNISSTNAIQQRNSISTMGHSTITPTTAATNNNVTASAVSSAPNTIGATGGPRECAGCSKPITERFLLKALDLFWHEDCLKCGCCDCRLGEVGSTLYTKANLILCKRDYLRLFGTTGYCAACNKVIPAFEMVMRAKSNVYHLECFACQQCNHRFCVGDRFYLCDNKILCEYDYEERLVFANMAYNPSSLAHIRRQVSNLQPAGDNMSCSAVSGRLLSSSNLSSSSSLQTSSSSSSLSSSISSVSSSAAVAAAAISAAIGSRNLPCFGEKLQLPAPPSLSSTSSSSASSNMASGPHRDDGSSGYGSPDSETFESPQAQ